MHSTFFFGSSSASASGPGFTRRHARAMLVGSVLAALLVACGGGGGGGGGGSASDAQSGSTSPTSLYVDTSGFLFPIGVAFATPTALSDSSAVVSGGVGITDPGVRMGKTLQQAVFSSQTDAVATGRLSLSGSGLLSAAALFDTGVRAHATSCFGLAVPYLHHDDAAGTSGTIAAGNVGIWKALSSGGAPCAAAEIDAQTAPLAAQVQQALLVLAGLKSTLAAGHAQAPAASASIDVTAQAATTVNGLLADATVTNASVALSDLGTYTYRIVLATGSGASAKTLELRLLHTPGDGIVTPDAGTLQIALSYLTSDASIGCTDQRSGSDYKVAHLVTVGYNRVGDVLGLRVRAGQYCGNASPASSSHTTDLAALTLTDELDPSVFLTGTAQGGTLGWRQGFVRFSEDLDMSTQENDFVYAWQDQPSNGAGHAHAFAGHGTLDVSAQRRTMALYQGHADDIATTDGTLRGLVCNAAGIGSTTPPVQALLQSQRIGLDSTGTDWAVTASHIAYAPTNSCSATGAMSFDVDGDGSVTVGEGSGTSPDLLGVTSPNTDVQDEIQSRGFVPPALPL